MTRRARLVWVAVGFLLLTLLVGRGLAVAGTERLWADALGVGEAHAEFTRLKLLLVLSAFVVAAAWCSGNLYALYRSIGSVSVPRHVGDIRLLEAVPRRYLRWGVVVAGLILAGVLSRQAGEWWYHRALIGTAGTASSVEPVLGRDMAYYLFELPWKQQLHRFALSCIGAVLVTSVILYGLAGAMRIRKGRVVVTRSTRVHLGFLLVAGALVLFWGFRLDPAEYVGGAHRVPLDAVLTEVRLPTATLLSVLSLVVAAVTVLWMWWGRNALLGAAWSVLVLSALLGRYVVPGFAGRARSPEQLELELDPGVRRLLASQAYGVSFGERLVTLPAEPDRRELPHYANEVRSAPTWDAFAVRAVLNRLATPGPFDRFSSVHLGLYRSAEREAVPLYLGVRELDFGSGSGVRGVSWVDVHMTPLAYSTGVVAIQANDVSSAGSPLFVAELDRPDRADTSLVEAVLVDSSVVFGPSTVSVAFVADSASAGTFGIPVQGLWRRLAFAWTLQRPQLVARQTVPPGRRMLWHRSVSERLDRVAPFAEFGDPYPVVADQRLYWIAPGYVTAEIFPLVPPVKWRAREIRYLRAGFVGLVDASTGRTSVYIARDPDPVSQAWAQLVPSVVQPFEAIPALVREHLRYPPELFDAQASVIRRSEFSDDSSPRARRIEGRTRDVEEGPESFWWVGRGVTDSIPRLRIRTSLETGDPLVLTAMLDGTVRDGVFALQLVRFEQPPRVPHIGELLGDISNARFPESVVPGTLRPVPVMDGVLYVLAAYLDARDPGDAPRLADVVVKWGPNVQRGPTLWAALNRAALGTASQVISTAQWDDAQRWFERMDTARRIGDWVAFAKAYDAFQRALRRQGNSQP